MLTTILTTLITLVAGFIAMTLFGHVSHWMLHQPWSGTFFKKHMTHHLRLYPTSDFLSDTYRDSGGDNTVFSFLFLALPFLTIPFILYFLHVIPLVAMILLLVEIVIVGKIHDYFHDSFHIRNHWLKRYRFFNDLTDIHYVHHVDMQKNFGIIFFDWDVVFGSWLAPTTEMKAPET